MKTTLLACTVALVLLLSSCGPSPEQSATMTAAAWTPTPAPTPTATPIPYDLTVHVRDTVGAPVAQPSIVIPQSGSDQPVQGDASGQVVWHNLPTGDVTLNVSAPGYFPAVQDLTLDRGPTEMVVIMQADPFALLPRDACAPDEKLVYLEDFQDTQAQDWGNITAAAKFGAANGWGIASLEEGNTVAAFTGVYHTLDDLQNHTFDNVVWRLKVQTHGKDGWSFLNFKHAPKEGGETRYTIQWGATPLLALGRLDLPDVGHFDVARGSLRMKQDQWYYMEISAYQGQVQVWVDGKKQIDYTNPQPLPPGTISLEANIPKDASTAYYFDNLSVCELSAPFATSLYKPPAP